MGNFINLAFIVLFLNIPGKLDPICAHPVTDKHRSLYFIRTVDRFILFKININNMTRRSVYAKKGVAKLLQDTFISYYY